MSLYRNILKQAWNIAWRNKYLWFFGIFAAMLGNGGEYEIIVKSLGGGDSEAPLSFWQRMGETGVFHLNTFSNIGRLFVQDPISLFMLTVIGIIILALIGFAVWLMILSQAGLVNNAANIINKKKTGFQDGVNSGTKYFWPVFGLNVLVKVATYVLFILLSLPIIFAPNQSGSVLANFFYIVTFIIFIPLAIAISFIIKYATAFIVIRGVGLMKSLKYGWRLFTENWLVSYEMAFILFFINLAVGLAVIIAILILAVPFLFLAFIFYYLASFIGFWLIISMGILALILLIVLSGGILAVFQISAWTGLFLELLKNGGRSKIIRIIDNFYNKT